MHNGFWANVTQCIAAYGNTYDFGIIHRTGYDSQYSYIFAVRVGIVLPGMDEVGTVRELPK